MAKNAKPPYRPNDEFDSPIIQIGGAVRSDFKRVSGILDLVFMLPGLKRPGNCPPGKRAED
jgi:hypothetical protein